MNKTLSHTAFLLCLTSIFSLHAADLAKKQTNAAASSQAQKKGDCDDTHNTQLKAQAAAAYKQEAELKEQAEEAYEDETSRILERLNQKLENDFRDKGTIESLRKICQDGGFPNPPEPFLYKQASIYASIFRASYHYSYRDFSVLSEESEKLLGVATPTLNNVALEWKKKNDAAQKTTVDFAKKADLEHKKWIKNHMDKHRKVQ